MAKKSADNSAGLPGFKVARDELLPRLQAVCGAVERSNIRPILNNVLLRARGGSLDLVAADSDIQVTTTVEVKSERDAATTVAARTFLDVLRHLPGEAEVEFKAGDGKRATLSCGRSRFVLQTLPAADFPSVEAEEEKSVKVQLAAADLRGLLARVQYATAVQTHRYYLSGVLLARKEGMLRAVATDGHRMALDHLVVAGDGDTEVIVPRKAVQELVRNLADGDGEAVIGERFATFSFPGFSLTAQLVDGGFPDYERVIPKENKNQFTAERKRLQECLQRVAVLSESRAAGVKWDLAPGERLKMECSNADQEQASDELEIDYGEGDKIETAFNISYISDILSHIETEKVRVALKDGGSSALITPDEDDPSFRYVVMPMRL